MEQSGLSPLTTRNYDNAFPNTKHISNYNKSVRTFYRTNSYRNTHSRNLSSSKTHKNLLMQHQQHTHMYNTSSNKFTNAYIFSTREQKTSFKDALTIQTSPSVRLYSPYTNNNKAPPQRSFKNIRSNKHNINTLYLTETNFNKPSTPSTTQYATTSPSFLSKIQEDISHEHQTKTNRVKHNQLQTKHAHMNIPHLRPNVRDFINKTREKVLLQYTMGIKKERTIRVQETYNNQIESIKETIASMEQAKELFANNFLQKFADYVKHLLVQKEEEKTRDLHLVDRIIRLRNEILCLERERVKMENEKKNISRWMYFQIMLKEKKLVLPMYYMFLLEKDDLNCEVEKNVIKCCVGMSVVNAVSFAEKERVKQYRKKVVFGSVDEFLGEFVELEKKNIQLLNNYYTIKNDLNELYKERQELMEFNQNENEHLNNLLNQTQIEHSIIKAKYIQLCKDKQTILKRNKNKMLNNNNIRNSSNRHNKYRAMSADGNNNSNSNNVNSCCCNGMKLFEKIIEVAKSCNNINTATPLVTVVKKGTRNTVEMEMLKYLTKIERGLDYLIEKNKVYMNGPKVQELRNIQMLIDKKHKIDKTNMQREARLKRIEKLKEQIEVRNKKVYFLPRRKVDYNYFTYTEKDINNKMKTTINDEPQFVDFMHDMI